MVGLNSVLESNAEGKNLPSRRDMQLNRGTAGCVLCAIRAQDCGVVQPPLKDDGGFLMRLQLGLANCDLQPRHAELIQRERDRSGHFIADVNQVPRRFTRAQTDGLLIQADLRQDTMRGALQIGRYSWAILLLRGLLRSLG